ncbi:MAG: inner membrane CreD family protein, partial [Chitinophagaceae bacterium]|nr:inner membrane CreD family protein [Chitinophagaceae bacterium]
MRIRNITIREMGRAWLLTSGVFSFASLALILTIEPDMFWISIIVFFAAAILTLPLFFVLYLLIKWKSNNSSTIQSTKMETTNATESQSGKTLIKGLITGALILLMLIPTVFINNLIKERKARQQEVVEEVSNKWASSQTLSGPFLYVPYKYRSTDTNGKPIDISRHFWILPDELNVTGSVDHQIRKRSIYKVLL